MDKLINLRKWVVRIALGLAIFIPVYLAIAALGSKFGIWDWRDGFGIVRNHGPNLMKLAVLLAAVSLGLSFFLKPRNGLVLSIIALLIPVVGLGYGQSIRVKGRSLPAIHDISTDTQDPPGFSTAILDLRGEQSNTVDYAGKTYGKDGKLVSAAQVKAYPDIRTIVLSDSPETAFENSIAAIEGMGWRLQSQSKPTGVLEATATTFWFGFKDDIVIRIRPADGGGSLVDIRSVSRVGRSDLGANAARIRKFSKKLQE